MLFIVIHHNTINHTKFADENVLFFSYIFHLNLAFSFDNFLRCDGNDIDNEVDDDFNLISKWLLGTIGIIYFSALLHCVDWCM